MSCSQTALKEQMQSFRLEFTLLSGSHPIGNPGGSVVNTGSTRTAVGRRVMYLLTGFIDGLLPKKRFAGKLNKKLKCTKNRKI